MHRGRAPHGARGLKQILVDRAAIVGRRAPHGARGLKHVPDCMPEGRLMSRPTRGTWIETRSARYSPSILMVAPHTGRVD